MERNKGKSLLLFPNEYVIIDIETTGLSPEYDEIIEIGAIKIKDNTIIDTYSTLVQPNQEINEFIEKLTGITNEMVENAPKLNEILPILKNFISDNYIIGYNVNFDINFLYDAFFKEFEIELKNDFIDILRIARLIISKQDIPNRKLKNVSKHFQLDVDGMHRVQKDCILAFQIFLKLQEIILGKYGSFENFIAERKKVKNYSCYIKDIAPENEIIDEDNQCYDNEFVFTGELERMTRKEAMQLVVNFGGKLGNSVTKKTNFLVMGELDYTKTVSSEKSSKIIKAEKLKLQGFDIEIIPESVFYNMLPECILKDFPTRKENKNKKIKCDILIYTSNVRMSNIPYNLELIGKNLSLKEKLNLFKECLEEGLIELEDKKITYEKQLSKLKVIELQDILKTLNLECSEKQKKPLISRILENVDIDKCVTEPVFAITPKGRDFLN